MTQKSNETITINAILLHHNGNTEITLTNTRLNLIKAITNTDIILSGVTIDNLLSETCNMPEATYEGITYFKLDQDRTVIHNFAPYNSNCKLYTTHYKISSVRKIDNIELYKKRNKLLSN